MKWLRIARAILLLIPAVITAIKALEDAIPGEGKGEKRLAAIREILQKIYDASDDAIVSFEDIWPAMQVTISTLVTAFNSVGWTSVQDEEDVV
jgi:hypothetical protein